MGVHFSSKEETRVVKKLQPPEDRTLLLLNDDFTTKEFVVYVLKKICNKGHAEAVTITENVHQNGVGIVGVYPRDIALTYVRQIMATARANGFPLRATTGAAQ